jgi:iron(III) transport system ATP-binding protein
VPNTGVLTARSDELVHAEGRLSVDSVGKSFGGSPVLHGVTLDVAPGEIVALLGPSGCGKTTLLRCIAGLERIDQGSVTVEGRRVADRDSHERPERRRIGMVFQDWALFPHLSVADNVGYGLDREARGGGRVQESLEMVGLAGLGERMPATLSGGQQQRVALARALAPRPSVLLLDEPFSNLDTGLRVQVRAEVHRLLTELGITAMFVTHDQEEAFVLGDRVAVMHDGRLEQFGSPAELYENPTSAWIASFVGDANFVRGHAAGDRAETALGSVALARAVTGEVDVLIRPEHLRVAPADGDGNGTVTNIEYFGHDHMIRVDLADGTRLACRAPGWPTVTRGQAVTVGSDGSAAPAFAV